MNVFLFSSLLKRMCLVTEASICCVNLEIYVNMCICTCRKYSVLLQCAPHLSAWKIKTFNGYNSNHVILLVQSEPQQPFIDPGRTCSLQGNKPHNSVFMYTLVLADILLNCFNRASSERCISWLLKPTTL